MGFMNWFSGQWFGMVHGHNLVYNTCWEDPRIDRAALDLGPDDNVLVITSAGCNALDYVLQHPNHVYAVDMNPRQNAVLEMKMAGIRNLRFDQFFEMFGRGRLRNFKVVYKSKLRPALSPWAQRYWDDHLHFFTNKGQRDSFYFYGTAGYLAWLVNCYLNRVPGLREAVDEMLSAEELDAQQNVYFNWVRDAFWNGVLRWLVGRDTVLSMVGVPRAQREYLERHYDGGVAKYVEDCFDAVFAYLPLGDNYFYRVYLTGQYTETCCPEYLKRENFERLKDGLLDRITTHTESVESFLRKHDDVPISRYVLLDHMDWLSSHRYDWLKSEWQAIVDRAAPNARLIWRSGGLKVDFVDPIEVSLRKGRYQLGELLTYDQEKAEDLHKTDRVHMYGSFYIADLATT